MTWGDGIAATQTVFLAVSAIFTYLTVRNARSARREEDERFAAARESERRRLLAAAEKERADEREARLLRLVEVIAQYERLRSDTMGGDAHAMVRAGALKVRLKTALIATGRDLPATSAYLADANPFPAIQLLDPSLAELHHSLSIYAMASHVPWEGEAG